MRDQRGSRFKVATAGGEATLRRADGASSRGQRRLGLARGEREREGAGEWRLGLENSGDRGGELNWGGDRGLGFGCGAHGGLGERAEMRKGSMG